MQCLHVQLAGYAVLRLQLAPARNWPGDAACNACVGSWQVTLCCACRWRLQGTGQETLHAMLALAVGRSCCAALQMTLARHWTAGAACHACTSRWEARACEGILQDGAPLGWRCKTAAAHILLEDMSSTFFISMQCLIVPQRHRLFHRYAMFD
jgi:hypothetical protein